MRYRALPLLGLAIACASASYTVTATAPTPKPVADVFTCVRAGITPIGYTQTSYDLQAHRLTARRYDDTIRRPDVRFRRMVDELEIEVRPDSGGRSAIVVSSRTFAEYMTERGQTLVQEAASDNAQAAGQMVLTSCGH
jgi:hypothetical protein